MKINLLFLPLIGSIAGLESVVASLTRPELSVVGIDTPQVPLDAGITNGYGVVDDLQFEMHHEPHKAASCFPALDFVMPSKTPGTLDGWWCNATDEYAFLGFSYEITACE